VPVAIMVKVLVVTPLVALAVWWRRRGKGVAVPAKISVETDHGDNGRRSNHSP
jgi:hypothetical protein